MAKKIKNIEKLQVEIELQKSKYKSLELLDKELQAKIARLQKQREDLKSKASKLKYKIEENQSRLKASRSSQ